MCVDPFAMTFPELTLTPTPGQNSRNFADDFFMKEKFCIWNRFSLFVPEGIINNIPALVQIMAWCLPGDKPLSEPMLTQFTDAYMQH